MIRRFPNGILKIDVVNTLSSYQYMQEWLVLLKIFKEEFSLYNVISCTIINLKWLYVYPHVWLYRVWYT